MCEERRPETIKHVDPLVHSTNTFNIDDENALSNTNNNTTRSVHFFKILYQHQLVQTKK